MKFTRIGKLKQDITIPVKLLEKAEEFIFRRLDSLLDTIHEYDAAIFEAFIKQLPTKLKKLVKTKQVEGKTTKVSSLVKEFEHLQGRLALVALHLDLFLQTLDLTESQFMMPERREIPLHRFNRSAFLPEFTWITLLVELIGKDKAITLYQHYTNRYIIKYDTGNLPTYATLEEMRENWVKFIESGKLGRIRVVSNVEDGRFIFRCDNCEKLEGIGDLDGYDRDILNTIICYGDFQVTQLYNEFFRLTRTQTIAAGHPYCDFVFHDTRLDKDMLHPPKEFFDGIWPLTDEE